MATSEARPAQEGDGCIWAHTEFLLEAEQASRLRVLLSAFIFQINSRDEVVDVDLYHLAAMCEVFATLMRERIEHVR